MHALERKFGVQRALGIWRVLILQFSDVWTAVQDGGTYSKEGKT